MKTYSYYVITESQVTLDFDDIFEYVKSTLDEDCTILDLYESFEDDIDDVILNTTNCFDFEMCKNDYVANKIFDDFEIYLENRFGIDWKNEKRL